MFANSKDGASTNDGYTKEKEDGTTSAKLYLPVTGDGAMALQFVFQAAGLPVPYQLFLMLPYLLTLVALAGAARRVEAPADLGRALD